MTSNDIARLVAERKWIPLAAFAIWIVVRLLKSDTVIPIDVPPRWRAPLAFGLGLVAAGLDMVAAGVDWQVALFDGILTALIAIFGHDIVVGSIRGGQEIPIPMLTIPGTRPAPNMPVTIEPPAPSVRKGDEGDDDPPPPAILGGT